MTQTPILVTPEGLENLKKEFEDLFSVKRPKAVKRLSTAKAQGDLSENSEYSAAVEELSFIDGRISELEEILRQAKAVVHVKKSKNGIEVGSKVTIKTNGKSVVFSIVGEWEADPKQQKISHSSPLGKALIGKKKGDKVEVDAPVGKVMYQIISID
jgi:transcription elongation factor GreA